jgi:putative ABC transport system permease protein
MVLLAMAAMALALALVGIYGVVSYSVAQRRSEVGIRVALGASMADVVWLVMRRSAVLIGLGIAIGLAGAWAFSRMPMLQDAGSGLPILAAVAVLFALTAGAACILPARRAASVDPLTALRQE